MLKDNFRLAWQFYRQENQYAYKRFLTCTQIILMVFIVTLSRSSDTIQDHLNQNLNSLLGADLVISQPRALSHEQQAMLASMSENSIFTQNIKTTLTHNDQWQRVTLKAVAQDYPFRGELRTAASLAGQELITKSGPKQGEIWLDSRLLAGLSIQVDEYLTIAQQTLRVSRILLHEPDRLMEGHNVDMRALIHRDDMLRIDFPEEIIHHRYLYSASSQQISDILAWQKQYLPAAQIVHKHGAHPLALFWQRTENFIGLASIILFFMAAIAIQQLTQLQVRKEQYLTAVCMSLGATKTTGLHISIMKWLISVLALTPFVILLSTLCHWLTVQWLTTTFMQLHWQFNLYRTLAPMLASVLIFGVFQLPVWIGLNQSSVSQLIHNSSRGINALVSLGCAVLVLAGVAAIYSDNVLLTSMVLGAMFICILLLLFTSWIALTTGEKLTANVSGLVPFALFMMKQRLLSKTTQILGVGLCAFLLLFTLMLLRDLGGTMEAYQRQHDGNVLVSQATDIQMDNVRSWATEHGVEIRQHKPFMYAKLTKINGQYLDEFTQQPSDSMTSFRQPIRLHWNDHIPSNNRLISGQWWQRSERHWQQISLEQEVMTDMGLKLGDRLSFFIGEKSVEFTISASHAYKPGKGSITFWVQMPATGLLHIDAPHYSMASLELDKPQFSLLNQLWQKHPSLRMISMQEIMQRFDRTLAMVTQVISGFSMLIILLASIVIVSSIHALEAKEKKKNSIIMSFGLSRKTCLQLNLIEWLVTGAIAASGAIIGTWIAGWLIYESQFSMRYQPDFLWLFATLSVILFAVTLLGAIASRSSLSSSIKTLMTDE